MPCASAQCIIGNRPARVRSPAGLKIHPAVPPSLLSRIAICDAAMIGIGNRQFHPATASSVDLDRGSHPRRVIEYLAVKVSDQHPMCGVIGDHQPLAGVVRRQHQGIAGVRRRFW